MGHAFGEQLVHGAEVGREVGVEHLLRDAREFGDAVGLVGRKVHAVVLGDHRVGREVGFDPRGDLAGIVVREAGEGGAQRRQFSPDDPPHKPGEHDAADDLPPAGGRRADDAGDLRRPERGQQRE